METTGLDIRRDRRVFEVVSLTFDFLRENLGPFAAAVFSLTGPIIVVMLACLAFLFTNISFGELTTSSEIWSISIAGILLALLYMVALATMVAAVTQYVIHYIGRGKGSFTTAEVRSAALRDIPRQLLISLTVMVMYVIIVAPVSLSGFFFIVCYPLAIWMVVSVTLAPQASAVERLGLSDAIRRSFELVRGAWWPTFGLILLMGMLVAVLAGVLMFPLMIFSSILSMHDLDPQDPAQMLSFMTIIMSIGYVLAYFILPLLYLAITFHYYSLVERTDGTATLEKISTIGADASTHEEVR